MPIEVTDPALLAQLNAPQEVTDPTLLKLLNENAPVTASGLAKQGGIGLAKGGIGLAGIPGDLGKLAQEAVLWGAGKLGASDERIARARELSDAQRQFPTSGEIQKGVEGVTGEFRKPQNMAEEYIDTAGQFLPAIIGGPESLVTRGLTRVALPAVASETAGQLTKGTAAEPYARAGTAIVAGGLGALRRTPQQAAPALEDIQNARNADYAAAHDLGIAVTPAALQREAGAIRADLVNQGVTGRTAQKTTAILDEMSSRQGAQSLADIDNYRKELGVIGRGANSADPLVRTDAMAARTVIRGIDDFLPRLAPADLASEQGNLARAVPLLQSARANAATAFKLQDLDRAAYRADLNAAAANSGANYENSLRQQLKQVLLRNQGLTADERGALERIVRGEGLRNAVRATGNLLGGGGGLGGLVTGSIGAHFAGPLGLAAPFVGAAMKKAGNAITDRAFNRVVNQIASNSPLGQAYPRTLPAPTLNPRIAVLMTAILARPDVGQVGSGGLLPMLAR